MDGDLKNYIDGLEDDSWKKLPNNNVIHIYSRVSTKSQEDNTSLKNQKDEGIKKAILDNKTPVLWNEGSASSSGDTFEERPVLEEVFSNIVSDDIKHLYAWDYDRLSRNERIWDTLKYGISDANVILYSRDSIVDLNNPSDRMLFDVRKAVTVYDNSLRAIRSKTGKVSRAKQGYYMNSAPPYGFDVVNKKLILSKKTSKHAKQIMKWYGDGISTQVIRQRLMKKKIPSANGNVIWAKGSLDKMVNNTCYVGYTTYRGVKVRNPRLLSVEEYKPIKDRMKVIKSANRGMTGKGARRYDFILTDKPTPQDKSLMICKECGGEMLGYQKNFYSKEKVVTHSLGRYVCGDSRRKYSIKNTDGRKRNYEGIIDLGKPCSMKFGLDRDTTDDYVFSVVNEVVKYSSYTREKFKKLILKDTSTSTGVGIKRKSYLERQKIKDSKDLSIFQELISNSNMDIAMSKISQKQHDKNIEKYNQQILLLEDKVDRSEEELLTIKVKDTYVDWYDIHMKNMESMGSVKGKARADIIKQYVDRIEVLYDKQEGIHILSLKFKYNIVDDKLIWKDKSNKKLGYDLIEGKNVKLLLIKKKQRLQLKTLTNVSLSLG
jgi:site-specific DNA recombinase